MVVEERADDAGAELGAQVEREVRHPHPVRQRTGMADRLRGAAGALAVVLLVGPQLERDGDRVAAVATGEQRDDRAVDAAGHRHQRALVADGSGQLRLFAYGRTQCPRERVGDQLGGVELAGGESAELLREVVRAEPCGVEQRHPLDQLRGRAERGDRRAARLRLPADGADAAAVVVERECDPHDVAAQSCAGDAERRTLRRAPVPVTGGQMVLEQLAIHDQRV